MSEMPAGAIPQWTQPDRLRKAREYAGLTQKELADAIGVAQRSVSAYESGQPVRRPVLLAWALGTGVNLSWLQDGTGSPGNPGGPVSSGWRSRSGLVRLIQPIRTDLCAVA